MAASRKIELPPALTNILVGLGNFAGRHVAEGVKRSKSSALREVRDMLRQASEIADAASRDGDDDIGPQVVDADFVPEEKSKVRRGR